MILVKIVDTETGEEWLEEEEDSIDIEKYAKEELRYNSDLKFTFYHVTEVEEY